MSDEARADFTPRLLAFANRVAATGVSFPKPRPYGHIPPTPKVLTYV
jgi:hypothetical protein